MKRILIMDEKNYSLNLEEIYRVAVRGIVFIGGKLLMIEDDFGEVKLPGGGINSTIWRNRRKETIRTRTDDMASNQSIVFL